MNTTPLHEEFQIPGFKVVPKQHLRDAFRPSQSAYYVLLGRRGSPDAPRESVLFVHYLDNFLESCQQQIERLWERHRVLITHVAVKIGGRMEPARHDLAAVYRRAVTVQHLREQLQPRFRRL